MSDSGFTLEELIYTVQSSKKYSQINSDLLARIAALEFPKYKDLKTAVKQTRSKIHRLTSAFQSETNNYAQLINDYRDIPKSDEEKRISFLKRLLRSHASTRERLPFVEDFFQVTLSKIAPVRSVLDMACGLNPLAIPFMPLSPGFSYWACDVVEPEIDFLKAWFKEEEIEGKAFVCDLLGQIPDFNAQLCLVMKTLPILDQIDAGFSSRLLQSLNCEHILITYPTKSLSGRGKGMQQTYSEHFNKLTADQPFSIQRFDFPNEIAYLLSK